MKKVLLKIGALVLVLCCLLPFFASCEKKSEVEKRVEKVIAGKNFTAQVYDGDDLTIAKRDGDTLYIKYQSVYEGKTYVDEMIVLYNKSEKVYRGYERSGDDADWVREDRAVFYFLYDVCLEEDVFGPLLMFFHCPKMFEEKDGAYQYVYEEENKIYTIEKDGKGIKCKYQWSKDGFRTTYVSDIGKTKIEIPSELKNK